VARDLDGVTDVVPRALPGARLGRRRPGCCDLAWALLFDVTDEPTVAEDWCADLAEDVLRWLPVEGFALPESDLVDWLHLPLRPRCAEVPARR
jgi:hypothetical protein